MNDLIIDIILLLVISASATMVLYIAYIEYKRAKHLNYIKEVISTKLEEESLLEEHETVEEAKGIAGKLHAVMLKAGITMPMYLFVLMAIAAVMFVGAGFTLFLKHWLGFVIGMPIGILFVYMFIQGTITRRKKEFNTALAVSISVLVKMMKNGIGFEQALVKSIEVSSSKLLKSIFADFFKEKNTIGEIQAFEKMYKLVESKELRIFAIAIKIGRESGGQFSNTLEKVEKTIQYRKKMQEKVDVLTREGSFGSYVVIGIAILLYFMLNGNFDGKLHEYFMNSEYGRFQLLGIMLWVFIGMMVNKLITRVDK